MFSKLNLEIQDMLLKDLGFLTLDNEGMQMEFVQRILNLPRAAQMKFLKLMLEKQAGDEYRQNVKEYQIYMFQNVIPKANKIIKKSVAQIEANEQNNADQIINAL